LTASSGAAGSAPLRAVPRPRGLGAMRGWHWALLVALTAGAAAGAGFAPFFILFTLLLIACGIGVLHSPLLFLWIITAISAIGLGWTSTAALEIAGRRINVNGLQWSMAIASCLIILVRTGRPSIPAALRGWVALAALAALGILWAPERFEGLKQFLLYAAPLLTALVAARIVTRPDQIRLLTTALYVAAGAGLLVNLVPSLAGDALGGSLDPEGRLVHREYGTFMLPVMALVLARLRYGDLRQAAPALILFAVALTTLSRTTLAAMMLLVVIAMSGTPLRLRLGLAGMVLVFALAAYSYEPVRERMFTDSRRGFTGTVEVSTGRDAQLHVGGIQLTGRGPVWVQTWVNAMHAPFIGHGTGSATRFVAERTRGFALFPHNEYLRVLHDFGFPGAGILLAAFGIAIAALRRLRRSTTHARTRELALAALMSWSVFAFIAIFDNPLGYFVFFTHNIFLLTVLAFRSAELHAAAETAQ
jgi:hypothetical protein